MIKYIPISIRIEFKQSISFFFFHYFKYYYVVKIKRKYISYIDRFKKVNIFKLQNLFSVEIMIFISPFDLDKEY